MPEIRIRYLNVQTLECLDADCVWRDWAETAEEAIELKNEHQQWHWEGKPQ